MKDILTVSYKSYALVTLGKHTDYISVTRSFITFCYDYTAIVKLFVITDNVLYVTGFSSC